MKHLRYFFLCVIIFLATIYSSNSQNYAGISSVGSSVACPGTIIIPLNLAGKTNLTAFSLTIYYDASVMSAIQNGNTGAFIENINVPLMPLGAWGYAQTDFTTGEKQVKIAWNGGQGVQLDTNSSGVAKICDLKFRYFGGTTNLSFDNSTTFGQNCEYVDNNNLTLIDTSSVIIYYINGIVTQGVAPAQPGIIIGPASPCIGNSVYSVLNVTGVDYLWTNTCNFTNNSNVNAISYNIDQTATVPGTVYVQASNTCGISSVSSLIISNISDSSSAPVSISATVNPVCSGNLSSLTLNGGSLGDGAKWFWYTGSCGGSFAGTNPILVVSPTANVSYFVRAEGLCNTTTCVQTLLTVNEYASGSSSISATPSNICQGSTSALNLTGGNLANNAIWYWYSGSCGGAFEGTGSAIIVGPSSTTDYFLRAEGVCNTTNCSTTTVAVDNISATSFIAIANPASICSGYATTLGITGGSLGTGASWFWFSNLCGGTNEGIGSSINVNPTINTTYYVRAEGTCNTTACSSVTVSLDVASVAVSTVSANPSVICSGFSTTLGISGGSLGTGADWHWYSNSCGGTNEGNGSAIFVIPTITAIYFVRAEGSCNTTSCVSTVVTVESNSIPNVTSFAAPASICQGSSSTLGISGGSLGTGSDWYWYINSCGNTNIGNGASLIVSPTVNTIYYVRAEGICNTTSCTSTLVTINIVSIAPSTASATPVAVCSGYSATLGFSGGSLGTGANWYWYSNSCGGSFEGNGSSIILTPTTSYVYYVRAEGTCNTTTCVSTLVTLNIFSNAVSTVSFTPGTICSGATATLGVSGGILGTGANWYWYSGSCGGVYEGLGTVITLNPTINTTYYVRAEGNCNTTTCGSAMISVDTGSITPLSASATPPAVCSGSSTTLGISGGSLGAYSDWYWYSNYCGGIFEGNGTTLIVNPMTITSYFVRAEGLCSTTQCVSTFVAINTASVSMSAITGSDTICSGFSATLSASGGSLGTSADWYWYSSSCGGIVEGNGANVIVSPTVNTVYFSRAEGACNTTSCSSIIVTVNAISSPISQATASPDNICSGSSATLGISGGSLGTGADWYWYSNTCGGTYEGNNSSIIVNPTISVSYFVRAEGTCNTTVCESVSIIINNASFTAISATSTPDTICEGFSVSLAITGGSLGFGANWYWYSNSCGGINEGNGSSIVVSPSVNTVYYVRAEGLCNTTACVSSMVTVNHLSSIPLSASATPDTICSGLPATLGTSGGNLGTNANWFWYSNSCGGTIEGNGISLIVNPLISTIYYTRAEGACNTTTCASITITVDDLSIAATTCNSVSDTICSGVSTTVSTTGGYLGTGAGWKWYSNSCGGITEGNGTQIVVSPTMNLVYFVRAEGTCNTTTCVTIMIVVNLPSSDPQSISATPGSICPGSSSTLGITGGSLGTGSNWYWYSNSCGGTIEGSGISLIVNPSITTVYYSRAEGICNTTGCATIIITLNDISNAATNLTSTYDTICAGTSITLSFIGGYSGTGANWFWYRNNCGGTTVGIGSTIVVAPTISTIYFVRAEGICNTTICISKTITVFDTSEVPAAIISNSDSVCTGSSITLGISGGVAGTYANWYWYSGACGLNYISSGSSLIDNPSNTIDYYLRAEGICNTTACVSKTITVLLLPSTSITSNSPVCYGDTLKLYCTGGVSYTWSDTANFISNLQNPEISDFKSPGKYYVIVTGTNGCTTLDSVNISLQPLSQLTGVLLWSGGVFPAINVTLELFREVNSVFSFYDSTNYYGGYTFNNLIPGNYILKATVHSLQYHNFLPSYFYNQILWERADTIHIQCNSNENKNIKMFEISPKDGSGIISGKIWYLNSDTKTVGEPVPGAEVFTSQEPGDDPISVSTTDTSGYYENDSIPAGFTYKLYVDIPGFPLISTYTVSLTPSNLTFHHLDFIVDTSDTGRGIYRQGGTGIENSIFPGFTISVFPNPFRDFVNINYQLSANSKVLIEAIDILGKVIKTVVSSEQPRGEYKYSFEGKSHGLNSNVFFIKVYVNNTVYLKKIIRSD